MKSMREMKGRKWEDTNWTFFVPEPPGAVLA